MKENVLLEAEGTFTWLSTEGEDLGKIEKKLELAEQVDKALGELKQEGKIAELENKYFGEEVSKLIDVK